MSSLADMSGAHGFTVERARALTPFGLTERQARFLVTVMLHSGVFVGRQYAAFAGITHGQKVHDFVEKLCAQRLATATAFGPTGRIRLFHVHHKPLYAALGDPDNRNRKPIGLGRAVERLMILDGVLSDPSLVWLGAERDKRRHFSHHLGNRLEPHQYPRLVFGKEPNTTTRFFPDKLPIGVEPTGRRHVFLYLVTSQTPMDFRQFLLRHAALLSAVGWWTIRLLVPRERARDMDAFEAAAYEYLGRPLHPNEADELRELFRRRQAMGMAADPAHQASTTFPKAFREPRFVALYRRWLEAGDSVLWLARSPVFRDALERREARIECVPLSHAYAYLSSQAGSS